MVTTGSLIRLFGRSACALAFLCAVPAAAQEPFFNVEREYTTPIVRVARPGSNETLDLVPAERLRLLIDVKKRIEKESGVAATLMITDAGKQYPIAYVTGTQGRSIALNIPMLRLLGDDADAMAAVLGHQYAHIALKHSEGASMGERVGASIVLTVLMAAARVPVVMFPNPRYVPVGFSGGEEREADEKGMAFAMAAGYSAEGGVRAWEGMAAQNKDAPSALVSTHSVNEDRVGTMRAIAAKYKPAPRAAATEAKSAAAVADTNPAAAISLKDLQELEARSKKEETKNARLWETLAGHYIAFGDTAAARTAYWQVARIEPANLDNLERLGAFHVKLRDDASTSEVWQALLKADPARAEAFFTNHVLP